MKLVKAKKVDDILKRTIELKDHAYWYGGKGQKASYELADKLRKMYPDTWDNEYYEKAKKDIEAGKYVGDCSYLVCHAYDIPQIGSYQIREKFNLWKGNPVTGMILWKPGHVGIYYDGMVFELRGIDYDFSSTRWYKREEWNKVLYSKDVDYDSRRRTDIVGWYKDGMKWWYRHSKGYGPNTYFHDCEFETDGIKYKFDSEGYLVEEEE